MSGLSLLLASPPCGIDLGNVYGGARDGRVGLMLYKGEVVLGVVVGEGKLMAPFWKP